VTGPEFISLGDMFAEVEAKAVAEAAVEAAAEKAAFDALSPEERARWLAERADRYERMFPDVEETDEPEDDGEEEDDQ